MFRSTGGVCKLSGKKVDTQRSYSLLCFDIETPGIPDSGIWAPGKKHDFPTKGAGKSESRWHSGIGRGPPLSSEQHSRFCTRPSRGNHEDSLSELSVLYFSLSSYFPVPFPPVGSGCAIKVELAPPKRPISSYNLRSRPPRVPPM